MSLYFSGIGWVSLKDFAVKFGEKTLTSMHVSDMRILFFKKNVQKFQNLVVMVTIWLKSLDTINFGLYS